MVERFNGRISEIVNQTRFGSAAELEAALRNYLNIYNHNIPQRALKHQTPIQALKKWQEERPELLVKRVYNQAGLDKYAARVNTQYASPLGQETVLLDGKSSNNDSRNLIASATALIGSMLRISASLPK